MKTEEKFKKKGKRNVSILTVFIWLALIAVMTVITINGVQKENNAYEYTRNVIFKLKIEGLTDEEIGTEYENYYYTIFYDDGYIRRFEYNTKENEYYTYTSIDGEAIFSDTILNIDIASDPYRGRDGYDCYCEYEINGKKYNGNKFVYIENLDISDNEDIVIYVTHKYIKNDNQGITKSSKWVNKEQGIAQIKLQYLPIVSETMYKNIGLVYWFSKDVLYADKLSQDFELSNEYVTNDEWSILESIADSDSIIPAELENELFDENGVPTGKKYIYVKSTNTVYWYINKNEFSTASNIDTFTFNVAYKEIDNEKIRDEVLNTNEGGTAKIISDDIFDMVISSPKLEYIREREAIIKINKEVKGEEGNNTYYVGLFTDDASNSTDKITKIETIDGKGVATIEIAEYNLKDKYYVYEVDENGNKISDEKLNYSRNNVIFEKANSLSIREITSNKEIVSEYISTDMTGIDLGRGTGEENYIDNVLSIRDVYEDNITISSEKIKYKVTYIPEDGGTIEGEVEEKVEPGKTPQNVPTPKPNEGYEFIRWKVEVNGERIEVIPSEYKINEDTIFYAIFEKIPVEESVDTSDINVGVYVVVLVVAVVGIASVVFFTLKNKKKSKENK